MAARLQCLACLGQRRLGFGLAVQCIGQHAQFDDLLPGKGQPAAQVGVERLLLVQVDRHVQQRARRRQPQQGRVALRGGVAGQHQCVVEVAAPHVAPVHQAEREHAAGRQRRTHGGQLLGRAHQVHVQAVHRQCGGQCEIVAERAEAGAQQQARAHGIDQHGIGVAEGLLRGGVEVGGEAGLVDLHPARTGVVQLHQQRGVGRQQRVEQGQALAAVGGLGQQQEADRAEQHRPGIEAGGLCFQELGHRFVTAQGEGLFGLQLGHEVVVVGVEPLGHFQRVQIDAVALVAARHREVAGQRVGIGQRAVARGDGVEQKGGIQHVVVQAEVVDRHAVGAGSALQLPMLQAQAGGGGLQVFGGAFAAPEGFQRALEFAAGADAREAQGGDVGRRTVHGKTCPRSMVDEERRETARRARTGARRASDLRPRGRTGFHGDGHARPAPRAGHGRGAPAASPRRLQVKRRCGCTTGRGRSSGSWTGRQTPVAYCPPLPGRAGQC